MEELMFMAGSSLGGFVILALVLGAVGFAVSKLRSRRSMISLVTLTSYELDAAAGTLEIKGRAPGLVGWLLNVVGLGAVTTFSVTSEEVRLNGKSMSGETLIILPADSVSVTRARFINPIWALAMIIFITLMAGLVILGLLVSGGLSPETMFPVLFGWFVPSLLFLLAYMFGKKLAIEVDSHRGSGPTIGISFKPSVLDGVNMTMDQLTMCAELINRRVIRPKSPSLG